MKLTLKNFKKHRSAEFTLQKDGMNVIVGNNGAGKTTIMKAISYAFYGNIMKPCSYGTTTCLVKLECEDLVVERSSKTKLKVMYKNKEYLDVAAQGVINGYLGMDESIFSACYMYSQRTALKNSVIVLQPTPQLKFIEKISFKNGECEELLKKFENNVRIRKEEYTRISSECEVAEKLLKASKDGLEEIESSIIPCDFSVGDIEKEISNKKVQLKEVCTNLEKHSAEYEKNKLFADLTSKIAHSETEINQIKKLKDGLGEIPLPSHIETLETELKELRDVLVHTKMFESASTMDKKYEEAKKEYQDSLIEELTKLRNNIPENADEILREYELCDEKRKEYEVYTKKLHQYEIKKEGTEKELEEGMKFAKETYEEKHTSKLTLTTLVPFLLKKKESTEKELLKLGKKIEEANKKNIVKKVYACPSCSVKFLMDDTGPIHVEETKKKTGRPGKTPEQLEKLLLDIVKVHEEKEKELVNIKKFLSLFGAHEPLCKPEECSYDKKKEKEITENAMKTKHMQAEIEVVTEKFKTLPVYISQMQKNSKSLYQKLPKSFQKECLNLDSSTERIAELEQKVIVISTELSKLCKLKSDHAVFFREITGKEKALNELKKKLPKKGLISGKDNIDINCIIDEIKRLSEEKALFSSQISEKYEKLSIVKELETKEKNYEKRRLLAEERQQEVDRCIAAKKLSERRYEGALGVEAVKKEARIKKLTETIDKINYHASKYLDLFFEDSISVRLCGEKEKGKDIQMQMNTVVEYNGNVLDSIDDLSDGQMQLCELAFFLGLNDMFKAKFIFFDESLNKVDPTRGPIVLNAIKRVSEELKDNGISKLFLFVAHEGVKGVFDEVIRI